MSVNNTAENILHGCGFSDKEQKVLAILLSGGSKSGGVIAKESGLKRGTVYSILEALIEGGIVTRRKKEGVAFFSCVDSEFLPDILAQRFETTYHQQQQSLVQLINFLKQNKRNESNIYSGYEIGTFERTESVMLQLQEILLSGDFLGVMNPQALSKEAAQVGVKYLAKTAVTKPYIREILVSGPVTEWYKSKVKNKNHIIREVAAEHNILTDMVIINDTVVLSHYRENRDFAIRIRQKEFYESMKVLFELVWNSLPESD
jgi:sugar-specific transcriptional regulator TrmB